MADTECISNIKNPESSIDSIIQQIFFYAKIVF